MQYKILQLNKDHQDQLFMRYKEGIKKSWYNEVWSGYVEPKNSIVEPKNSIRGTLEHLYYIFNMEHPNGFRGHSLSVSDVVYLDGKYYYCTTFGYKELTDFED